MYLCLIRLSYIDECNRLYLVPKFLSAGFIVIFDLDFLKLLIICLSWLVTLCNLVDGVFVRQFLVLSVRYTVRPCLLLNKSPLVLYDVVLVGI